MQKKSKVLTGTLSKQSLIKIMDFNNQNKEFEKLRKKYISKGYCYTKMKMIDMCFWQMGYDIEENKQKTDEPNRLSRLSSCP